MSELGTAVVTGATGFIGAALVRRLAESGTRVICPVRAASPRLDRIEGTRGVEILPLESFDADALRNALPALRCDAVFHLAAHGVSQAERDPVAMAEGNVMLTTQVLCAAQSWSTNRFVYAGSCSEYAPAPPGTPIGEDHPLAPPTLHGGAKAAAHIYGAALAAHLGMSFVGLRLFGTYGLGEAPHRLLPYIIDHLSRDEQPDLTPGEHQRDLTYVDDVVDALVTAATHTRIVPGSAYNVCSGVPRRIADVARRVAVLMGRSEDELGLGRRPHRPDEPMWIVGDPTRFQAATGWRPRVSLEEGIRRMIVAAIPSADASQSRSSTVSRGEEPH